MKTILQSDTLSDLVKTMDTVLTDEEWKELVKLIMSQDKKRSDHPHTAECDYMQADR